MDVSDHLNNIRTGLAHYGDSNRRPCIDEPANDFERQVVHLNDLQELKDEVKALTKALDSEELELRKGIAESLRAYFADKLKEGVNNYPLSNGRKLKFTHKVERKVDNGHIEVARQAYEELNEELSFTALTRMKYELDKRNYDKLSDEGRLAASRMIVTSISTPTLKVD